MDPVAILIEKQPKLVEQWIAAVISTYPPESSKFFIDTKDPFANPVGSTIKRSISLLFNELIKEKMDPVKVNEAMDPIIRLRAVQEMSPATAVSFIFAVKNLIRKELDRLPQAKNQDKTIDAFLAAIESNVDALMLTAIDIYVHCREKIYSLRINQAKESVKKLLIKKGLMCDIPDTKTDINTELQTVISKHCTGIL
jgi:hypothetical protein